MKALNLKNIFIRVLMSSGLFLNATAQDDLTGLRIPAHFQNNTELAYANVSNDCCGYSDAEEIEIEKTAELETRSWIVEKNKISLADLPKAIIRTLVDEYEVNAVLDVSKIETSVREAYKLRIVKNNEQWDIFITKRGDILMEEKITS